MVGEPVELFHRIKITLIFIRKNGHKVKLLFVTLSVTRIDKDSYIPIGNADLSSKKWNEVKLGCETPSVSQINMTSGTHNLLI